MFLTHLISIVTNRLPLNIDNTCNYPVGNLYSTPSLTLLIPLNIHNIGLTDIQLYSS